MFSIFYDIPVKNNEKKHRIHAEENKRRTLQRSDIAAAIAKTDMFDFLIDIVPREEYKISLPKEHKTHHDLAGPDRRRSQEIFQPLPGPTGATGPRRPNNGAGIGGGMDANNLALDNYSYPFGILDQGDFTLVSMGDVMLCIKIFEANPASGLCSIY